MKYSLDDLSKELTKLEPGYGIAIGFAIYRQLFAPGEPDEIAQKEAEAFANANGATINFAAYRDAVFFRRKRSNEITT